MWLEILRGAKSECPEVFDESDCYYLQKTDHYYVVEYEDKIKFRAAENKCKEIGGELANIDSPEEQEFLSGLATSEGLWIGLKKIDTVWKWVPSKQEVVGNNFIVGDAPKSACCNLALQN